MKRSVYETENSNLRHTFGGLIYLSDYNTECRHKKISQGSAVANRIAQDKRFDEQCKRNVKMQIRVQTAGQRNR